MHRPLVRRPEGSLVEGAYAISLMGVGVVFLVGARLAFRGLLALREETNVLVHR